MALVSDLWTLFYVFLILVWQIAKFLTVGNWPSLLLSSILAEPVPHFLLHVPVILLLLLMAALLTIFYLWLKHIERNYSKIGDA